MTAAPLSFEHVEFAYRGCPVFEDLSLAIRAGEIAAVLGPNGCGKTTLVRLATGVVRPAAGRVVLGLEPLSRLTPRQVARRVAVVPQEESAVFSFSVEEAVLMGRTPWLGRFGFAGEEDLDVVKRSLALVDGTGLLGRDFDGLSGGERQRVLVARALAQDAELLVLDEPTSHLDIRHQVSIVRLLNRLKEQEGLTIVFITHDVNLAARFSDRLLLLAKGAVAADGPPREVLDPDVLERVYGTAVRVRPVEGLDVPWVFPE